MIHIHTKSKLLLYIIIILLITLTVIGFMRCQCEAKRTITDNKRTIDTDKRTIEIDKRTIEIETDKEGDSNRAVKPVSLGEFKLTAYCPCELCCGIWNNNRPIDENGKEIIYGAIGERLKEGHSIAVDPDVIPYNSEVIIDGKTYEAQDCGGAIKDNRIDVYFEDHNDALEFGVQYEEVFINL